MSGALTLRLGGGNPVVFSWAGDITHVVAGGPASGNININTTGTITGGHYTGASAWCVGTPPVTYYVKFSVTGSAWDAGLTAGTVYALSSSRTVSWSASGTAKSGTLTVNIYADAGGTVLLGTGTVSYLVDGSP